ncbi:transcriptional regulator, tetr family [hydrocarbon metagenome]|uniref:Transcriptional regulator, tetr family n=1 Tax=hydrocarbon metagenome TaxID=938273 RepID=A0A0W8FZE9_9ZZZZ
MMNTKEKIFLTAAELFSKSGYDSVSVREICDAAGITKPVLYYYFKDKESLLKELIEETFRIGDELKQKYFKEENDFFENIYAVIKIYKVFLKRYRPFAQFSAFLNTMTIPDELVKRKTERAGNEMKLFKKYLKYGQDIGYVPKDSDIDSLANIIIGSVAFVALQNILFGFNKKDINKKLDNLFVMWKKDLFIEK